MSGCAQSVTVDTSFPTPLVEPLPLVVGIRYPNSLSDFVHVEEPPLEAEWTVRLGEANVRLFNALFSAMFAETVVLSSESGGDPDPRIDAIIEPRLERFEFSLPRQAGNEFYAVWLRYNIKVFTPDGELISNWPVSAYGQSGKRMLAAETSMKLATELAMRDAAASIAVGFANAPGIQKRLLDDQNDEEEQTT